jgi:phosphatidylserine/phosphatidylglycerophosphate/cardiolipin synthase-like enzyme
MNRDTPLRQSLVTVDDGKLTTLSKEWFYQDHNDKDKYYPKRTGTHVTPLVCGKETLPELRRAVDHAKDSIDISLWCFDPALCMQGYNPALNIWFGLYQSLQVNFRESPRAGDILLAAAARGVKVRLLIWTLGDLIYNPKYWSALLGDVYNSGNAPNRARGAAISGLWDILGRNSAIIRETLELDRLKRIGPATILLLRGLLSHPIGQVFLLGAGAYGVYRFFSNNPNFLSNWLYRHAWYDNLARVPGITIKTIGDGPSASDINAFITALKEKTVGRGEGLPNAEDEFLERRAALEGIQTHHQKCAIVDDKLAFVMGNNLKMVDFDEITHPVPAPSSGGRFPAEDPRQDISSLVYGDILPDLRDNFERLWGKATLSPACLSRAARALPQQISYEITSEPFTLDSVYGPSQLSTTLIGQKGEGYIARAYKKAINESTEYLYFENQYFRYEPLAEKLKQHAKVRFQGKKNGLQQPLYFFVVTNNVEPYAAGSSYKMLQELGHDGQMPAEQYHRAQKTYEDAQKAYSDAQKQIEDTRKRLNDLERRRNMLIYSGYNDPGQYGGYLRELEGEIEKQKSRLRDMEAGMPERPVQPEIAKPKAAEAYPEAKDAFTLQEDASLKGHIATMLVSVPKTTREMSYEIEDENVYTTWKVPEGEYQYVPVNIHSKTMIVDDVFVIIGSCNMHMRGMETDNEIDVSTTREGVARGLRRKLFQALMDDDIAENNEQINWQDIYDKWKEILDGNWRKHFNKQQLQGFLFYMYSPDVSSEWPTLD